MAKKILNFIIYITIGMLIIILLYGVIQRKISGQNYTNIFGYTILEVLTGSMSGTIEVGDGVIVKVSKDVKENDIIVYKRDNQLITHRLIGKQKQDLITKGDANNVQDMPITAEMVVGKVIYIIPYMRICKKIGVVFIGALICIFVIKNFKQKKNQQDMKK